MSYRKLAEALLRDGDRHSEVYIDGLCAALRLRMENKPSEVTWAQGSLEYDAYFYGCRRGAAEYRNALSEAQGNRERAIEQLWQLAGDAERRVA